MSGSDEGCDVTEGSDWGKPTVGWSEEAPKAVILGTQITRSRPSGNPGERVSQTVATG